MKKFALLILIYGISSPIIYAQDRAIEAESSITTNHTATILGERFQYSATAGTQPVWDEDGKTIATLFIPTISERMLMILIRDR